MSDKHISDLLSGSKPSARQQEAPRNSRARLARLVGNLMSEVISGRRQNDGICVGVEIDISADDRPLLRKKSGPTEIKWQHWNFLPRCQPELLHHCSHLHVILSSSS